MAACLLVAFSALLLFSAFPSISFWPAAFVALIPFVQALEGLKAKDAFRTGFLWGLFFFFPLLWWLVPTISTYGRIHFLLAVPVVICLCCYLALYPALWAMFVKWLLDSGQAGLFFVISASSLWIVLEALRGVLFSGFPWGLMAYSLCPVPVFIQSADIWSVYGLGFFLVFFNLSIFEAVRMMRTKRAETASNKGVKVLFASLLCLLLFFFSYGVIKTRKVATTSKVWAAAVQASMDQSQKWDPALTLFTLNRYKELTHRAKKEFPELRLAVWPETAMPFYFQEDTSMKRAILDFARKEGLFILLGSPSYTYGKDGRVYYLNSAYAVGPKGIVLGRYDKHHLVPFGEYMPWGPVTAWARRFLPTAGDFIAGKEPTPLNAGPFKIGTMICFESIFPEIARKEVEKGANILAVITNDAWFGRTAAPYQHADMAIFRAVETRRWLVRAANTGVSRIISPIGEVLKETRLFVPSFVAAQVGLGQEQTIFVRFGSGWFVAMNFLVIIFCIYRIRKDKTKTRGSKEASRI